MATNEATEMDNDLRQQVKAAIEPFEGHNSKPTFTEAHMVVMALVCADKPLTIEEILDWAARHFYYYRKLIVTGFWSGSPGARYFANNDAQDFRYNVYSSLRAFEVPLQYAKVANRESWTVASAEARTYLREVLCRSQSSKRFRFFDLPAELRTTIYEMVFSYAATGLHIRCGTWTSYRTPSQQFYLTNRSYDEKFNLGAWEESRDHVGTPEAPIDTKRMAEILQPLLLCRQFYAEAKHVFYRINHFYFFRLDHLHCFLNCTAIERRKHISHISVTYTRDDDNIAPRAFKLLAEIEHLRKLNIRIDEQRWLNRGENGRIKKYNSINNMPGLGTLRSIRGLEEVNFVGPCPTIESMCKAEMLKPKFGRSTVCGTKKRKVTDSKERASKGETTKKAKLK